MTEDFCGFIQYLQVNTITVS